MGLCLIAGCRRGPFYWIIQSHQLEPAQGVMRGQHPFRCALDWDQIRDIILTVAQKSQLLWSLRTFNFSISWCCLVQKPWQNDHPSPLHSALWILPVTKVCLHDGTWQFTSYSFFSHSTAFESGSEKIHCTVRNYTRQVSWLSRDRLHSGHSTLSMQLPGKPSS